MGPVAVLIFTHKRADYLDRTLETLYKYKPEEDFPVIVSQDLTDKGVMDVVKRWQEKKRIQHIVFTERDEDFVVEHGSKPVYYYIAQHFGFGLSYVFDTLQYHAVIILEGSCVVFC